MSNNNNNMHNAKVQKNDEFYTRMEDIKLECNNYKAQFRNKVIYCNCDDPVASNFFQYFAVNFKVFGLKKLICTCYDKSNSIKRKEVSIWDDIENTINQLNIPVSRKGAYKIVIPDVFDVNGDDIINSEDIYLMIKNDIESGEFKYVDFLQGDGDFRSEECVKLLDESDIVVTNPPFSLFREFIELLESHNKKYLIIGNNNAITYKEIFPLIKNNKLWLGYSVNKTMEFEVPEHYTFTKRNEQGKGMVKVSAISWFTNLDVRKRHDHLFLYKKYTENEYPMYDNYNAINVGEVDKIPCDYMGVMGVPITFLDKYNPEDFEIIGHEHDLNGNGGDGVMHGQFEVNGKGVYKRVLIRRK